MYCCHRKSLENDKESGEKKKTGSPLYNSKTRKTVEYFTSSSRPLYPGKYNYHPHVFHNHPISCIRVPSYISSIQQHHHKLSSTILSKATPTLYSVHPLRFLRFLYLLSIPSKDNITLTLKVLICIGLYLCVVINASL